MLSSHSARARSRIVEVNERVQRIVAGDLRERLPHRNSDDPFSKLALSVNGMLDEMETLIQSLAGIGNDIAHDLRTPLTRARLMLERGRTGATTLEQLQMVADKTIEALDQALAQLGRSLAAALLIDVSAEEVVRRLSGRRVCVKGQHNFHVDYDPPKHTERCDVDGSRLVVREDDRPEVIQHRLEQYHEKTEPLIGYYERQGILRRIDGARSADHVHDQIRATLASLRLEGQV